MTHQCAANARHLDVKSRQPVPIPQPIQAAWIASGVLAFHTLLPNNMLPMIQIKYSITDPRAQEFPTGKSPVQLCFISSL